MGGGGGLTVLSLDGTGSIVVDSVPLADPVMTDYISLFLGQGNGVKPC